MKLDDKYASEEDITMKDKSVLSGKSIAQMEQSPNHVYGNVSLKKTVPLKINAP